MDKLPYKKILIHLVGIIIISYPSMYLMNYYSAPKITYIQTVILFVLIELLSLLVDSIKTYIRKEN